MEKVAINNTEAHAVGEDSARRGLSESLETTDIALNHYRIAPGEGLPGGLHAHMDQEEVFYVMEGVATFETEASPVEVTAGELLRFGPGELQRGWNSGDATVRALALGAPLEYGTAPKLRDCPACGERTENELERATDEEAVPASKSRSKKTYRDTAIRTRAKRNRPER